MSTAVQTETKQVLKTPAPWKVLFHNDDFTPMDFVTHVLIAIFGKSQEEAEKIMLAVHMNGIAIVGLYTKDIAVTKVAEVETVAQKFNHPLKATAEEA